MNKQHQTAYIKVEHTKVTLGYPKMSVPKFKTPVSSKIKDTLCLSKDTQWSTPIKLKTCIRRKILQTQADQMGNSKSIRINGATTRIKNNSHKTLILAQMKVFQILEMNPSTNKKTKW